MWFDVVKDFGHLKAGHKVELKEDSQYKLLVEKGLIKEGEVAKVEKSEPVADDVYSTDSILTDQKKIKKVKEDKQ